MTIVRADDDLGEQQVLHALQHYMRYSTTALHALQHYVRYNYRTGYSKCLAAVKQGFQAGSSARGAGSVTLIDMAATGLVRPMEMLRYAR